MYFCSALQDLAKEKKNSHKHSIQKYSLPLKMLLFTLLIMSYNLFSPSDSPYFHQSFYSIFPTFVSHLKHEVTVTVLKTLINRES